jgi:tripartite ATP-independent transporter DctP family solute receptor
MTMFAVILAGCGGKTEGGAADEKVETIVLRASTPTEPDTGWTQCLEVIAEEVEKNTNGKVEVQIYPGGQLGGEERTYQDIQNRVVQIGSMAVNNAALFSPSLLVFDLPYIFPSAEACYKVMDENWDAVNERMIKESGNMAIAWMVQGFRVLSNSQRPVKTLADLSGLKIRVPNNPVMIDTFRAWGCDPTPMAWDETFNALQQHVVDGQENPYTVFASNKFEEVQKYITNVHYKMWLGPVVVNASWLKKQPEDVQKAILDAGKEVTKANRALIAQMEADLIAELTKKGFEVDMSTAKSKNGKMIAVYLKGEFGGFAVHLLQK